MRKFIFEKLIIATTNKGKYNEFVYLIENLSQNFAREIIFAPEIASLIVEETGKTYSENAKLKALAWSKKSGLPCLADDSGLEVESLNGAPGLFSARIIKGSDTEKNHWLLTELENKENRRARFVASIAISIPDSDSEVLVCEGECKGVIAKHESGENGFGYDPIFIPDGFTQTFAQIDSHTKNLISHRADAFRKIYDYLSKNFFCVNDL